MRYEFLRFKKPLKNISKVLRKDLEHNLDGVLVKIIDLKKLQVHSMTEQYLFSNQTQFQGSLEITCNKSKSKSTYLIDFNIRMGSRIWMLGTDDNPLLLQWCLDFFKDIAGLEADYQSFDRTKIKTFLKNTETFEIKVETPRGPRDIESMISFTGEPLLSYDLSSADLLLKYEGEFEIELSLESLLIDSHASDKQREFALQYIENYLF